MDRAQVCMRESNGGGTVCGVDHVVSLVLQRLACQASQMFFIFYEQNRFMALAGLFGHGGGLYRYFQQFVGEDYGVHWLPTYVTSEEPFTETEMLAPKGPFPEVFPDMHDLQPGEHRFPYRYVRQFRAMLIEPHPYLRALLRDFRLAGGKVVVQEFHESKDLATLPEPAVVNCTGLGAKSIFGDSELLL